MQHSMTPELRSLLYGLLRPGCKNQFARAFYTRNFVSFARNFLSSYSTARSFVIIYAAGHLRIPEGIISGVYRHNRGLGEQGVVSI